MKVDRNKIDIERSFHYDRLFWAYSPSQGWIFFISTILIRVSPIVATLILVAAILNQTLIIPAVLLTIIILSYTVYYTWNLYSDGKMVRMFIGEKFDDEKLLNQFLSGKNWHHQITEPNLKIYERSIQHSRLKQKLTFIIIEGYILYNISTIKSDGKRDPFKQKEDKKLREQMKEEFIKFYNLSPSDITN